MKCETLTQPASVTVQPGQRLTITCQVSYSVSSYWTAWIRQPAGKELEWIGMRVGSSTIYKDSLKNKFSIDLDSSSKTVTLKSVLVSSLNHFSSAFMVSCIMYKYRNLSFFMITSTSTFSFCELEKKHNRTLIFSLLKKCIYLLSTI